MFMYWGLQVELICRLEELSLIRYDNNLVIVETADLLRNGLKEIGQVSGGRPKGRQG